MSTTKVRQGVSPVVRCARRTISATDVSNVSNAVFNWTLITYARVNIDKVFERHIGEQLAKRLPHLPDRGSTPGTSRDWKTVIHHVFQNRRKTSAEMMYERHSIRADAVTEDCKRLIDKGLKVNTHNDSDALFAVDSPVLPPESTVQKGRKAPALARPLQTRVAQDELSDVESNESNDQVLHVDESNATTHASTQARPKKRGKKKAPQKAPMEADQPSAYELERQKQIIENEKVPSNPSTHTPGIFTSFIHPLRADVEGAGFGEDQQAEKGSQRQEHHRSQR